MKKFLATAAIGIALSANAFAAEMIGKVETSGMIFKDRIEILAFDDPTVKGVACYVTNTVRSMSFEDPSDSSLSCRKIGPISGNLNDQPHLFSQAKNAWFKTVRVDRFWDAERKVLVYISYTTKTSGNNHSHSISVVPVGE